MADQKLGVAFVSPPRPKTPDILLEGEEQEEFLDRKCSAEELRWMRERDQMEQKFLDQHE